MLESMKGSKTMSGKQFSRACAVTVAAAMSLALALPLIGCGGNAGKGSAPVEQQAEKKAEPKVQEVAVGEEFSVKDRYDLTLSSAEWRDEIGVATDSITWTIAENEDGSSYFVINATVKNMSAQESSVMYGLEAKLEINDKYKLDSDLVLVEPDGSGFGYELGPLESRNLLIYASVSDEIKAEFKKAQLSLSVMDEEFNEDGERVIDFAAKPMKTFIATFE